VREADVCLVAAATQASELRAVVVGLRRVRNVLVQTQSKLRGCGVSSVHLLIYGKMTLNPMQKRATEVVTTTTTTTTATSTAERSNRLYPTADTPLLLREQFGSSGNASNSFFSASQLFSAGTSNGGSYSSHSAVSRAVK
jgi:hypothetical protein